MMKNRKDDEGIPSYSIQKRAYKYDPQKETFEKKRRERKSVCMSVCTWSVDFR